MHEKSDFETWEEYAYEPNTLTSEEYAKFAEKMAEQTREALLKSNLYPGRYRVDERQEKRKVIVWADGWEMDVDDVLHLRNEIQTYGVGDETVAVECSPRGPEKEVVKTIPDEIPRCVQIQLRADFEETDEMLASIFTSVNEAMAHTDGL